MSKTEEKTFRNFRAGVKAVDRTNAKPAKALSATQRRRRWR